MKRFAFMVIGSAVLTTACSGSGDSGAAETEQQVDKRVGSSAVLTDKADVRLLGGYNSLFDLAGDTCVSGSSSGGPALSVGNVEEQSDITYVSNRAELSKETDVDIGLNIKYGPVTAGAKVGFINSLKRTNNSVNFLMRATQSYTVSNTQRVALNTDAGSLLRQADTSEFLRKCGDRYVSGIKYQASLYVLFSYDTDSLETAKQITTDISGSGGATVAGKGLEVGATLQTKLINNKSRSGVTARVTMLAQGFVVGGSTPGLIQGAEGDLTADTFARVESLRTAMATSIVNDICRDGGDFGQCNGVESPGYEKNRTRQARATLLNVQSYATASGSPAPSTGAYMKLDAPLVATEAIIRGYEGLRQKMEDAYSSEIQPFLTADATAQTRYGVAGGKPVATVKELIALANTYAPKFRPNESNGIGTITEQLNKTETDCWDNGMVGDFTACNLSTPVTSQATYRAVSQAISDYSKNARVLPLAGVIPVGKLSISTARGLATKAGTRLPTADEVLRMGPMVGATKSKQAWFEATGGECTKDQEPFLDNSEGKNQLMCHTDGFFSTMRIDSFAVGTDGIFGVVTDL